MTGALLVSNQISLRLNNARYTSFHPFIYVYIVTRKRSIRIRGAFDLPESESGFEIMIPIRRFI